METQAGDRAFRAVGASGTLEAREPLSWAKGSLGSLQESESLVEVTASIPGVRMLSPGFGEESEGGGHGRLLRRQGSAGGAEGPLCFIRLAFPLIPQYL